jgi:hypothetical protein
MFTVEHVVAGTVIYVYTQMGVCVKTALATGETTNLTLNLPAGVYVIRNENKEGKVTIIKY